MFRENTRTVTINREQSNVNSNARKRTICQRQNHRWGQPFELSLPTNQTQENVMTHLEKIIVIAAFGHVWGISEWWLRNEQSVVCCCVVCDWCVGVWIPSKIDLFRVSLFRAIHPSSPTCNFNLRSDWFSRVETCYSCDSWKAVWRTHIRKPALHQCTYAMEFLFSPFLEAKLPNSCNSDFLYRSTHSTSLLRRTTHSHGWKSSKTEVEWS